MPLVDDLTNLSHDVIIKLDEAGGAAPDVGVIEVLGAGVKSLQVLITEVHHHHLLVESLHSEAEVEVVHTAILLQMLEERVDEVSVLQQGGEVHMETGGLGLAMMSDKPEQSQYFTSESKKENSLTPGEV